MFSISFQTLIQSFKVLKPGGTAENSFECAARSSSIDFISDQKMSFFRLAIQTWPLRKLKLKLRNYVIIT